MGHPGVRLSVLRCLWGALCIVSVLGATVYAGNAERTVTLYFFRGEGCPVCEKAQPFVAELNHRYPALQVREYEVFEHRANVELLRSMARAAGREATAVPVFIVDDVMIEGFSPEIGRHLEAEVRRHLASVSSGRSMQKPPSGTGPSSDLDLPLIGRIRPDSLSLPVFTLIIAGLDSFNPCAFFVLFFLLSLLIHAHSRRRMMIIGGTFVFCSGLVYFLFMSAWLNLFLLTGSLTVITSIAGIAAVCVACINIKDYFFFRQGISLTIAEEAKPHLFQRMRGLLHAASLPAMLGGTVVLAVTANAYELLCTAGFPMVFTRVLTLRPLPASVYYLYLAGYNVVYVSLC